MFAIFIYICKFIKNKGNKIMVLIYMLLIVLLFGVLLVPYLLQVHEKQEEQKRNWINEQNKRNK
tara:strand:- start:240 stop:431 length:192 start_codon:yes stop_codon:yes gene_type:complete